MNLKSVLPSSPPLFLNLSKVNIIVDHSNYPLSLQLLSGCVAAWNYQGDFLKCLGPWITINSFDKFLINPINVNAILLAISNLAVFFLYPLVMLANQIWLGMFWPVFTNNHPNRFQSIWPISQKQRRQETGMDEDEFKSGWWEVRMTKTPLVFQCSNVPAFQCSSVPVFQCPVPLCSSSPSVSPSQWGQYYLVSRSNPHSYRWTMAIKMQDQDQWILPLPQPRRRFPSVASGRPLSFFDRFF